MTAEPKYDNLEVMKVHIDSSWVSLARLTKKQSMIKKCKKKNTQMKVTDGIQVCQHWCTDIINVKLISLKVSNFQGWLVCFE